MHQSTALIDAEKMPVSCLVLFTVGVAMWFTTAVQRPIREAAASFHEGRPQARLEPAIISRIARSSMRTRF
jgi:hypothetical protein